MKLFKYLDPAHWLLDKKISFGKITTALGFLAAADAIRVADADSFTSYPNPMGISCSKAMNVWFSSSNVKCGITEIITDSSVLSFPTKIIDNPLLRVYKDGIKTITYSIGNILQTSESTKTFKKIGVFGKIMCDLASKVHLNGINIVLQNFNNFCKKIKFPLNEEHLLFQKFNYLIGTFTNNEENTEVFGILIFPSENKNWEDVKNNFWTYINKLNIPKNFNIVDINIVKGEGKYSTIQYSINNNFDSQLKSIYDDGQEALLTGKVHEL